MIRQYKSSPLLLVALSKPVHQVIHYHTANFRPLSRGSVSNPMLITVFDTYLSSRSLGALEQVWSLNEDPSNSEYSALTHFSQSLTPK